jgi:hypothetical protein
MYDRIILDGLRYLTDDIVQIKRMTADEYELRINAKMLRRADRLAEHAQAALFNRVAQSVDKSGKRYVAKTVKDIYNIEQIEEQLYTKVDRSKYRDLIDIAKRLSVYRRVKNVRGT